MFSSLIPAVLLAAISTASGLPSSPESGRPGPAPASAAQPQLTAHPALRAALTKPLPEFSRIPAVRVGRGSVYGAAGLTDKTYGRDGYFEYKLADGRIWTRWNPVLASGPVDVPVTEAQAAEETGFEERLSQAQGPYSFRYDKARRVIVAEPKPNASRLGFVVRGGRLVPAPRQDAESWHLHDLTGGPELEPGVKIIEIQTAGGIIAARASDGVLHLYKPTITDAELPTRWETSVGTPFGGVQRFPAMRDWAFGLSIGVKPSERPTVEIMNPAVDIDNWYGARDGSRSFFGFTATVGALSTDGREIRYWDTGLPADFARGFTTPERGRVVGEKLAQAGSTWLLYGRDRGRPGLWVKAFDHEMIGSTPGLRYTYKPGEAPRDRIQDLAEALRFVPLPPWREVPLPALSGRAQVTDRISLRNIGQGDDARELVIEGTDASGAIGAYHKELGAKEWSFTATGAALLLGRPVVAGPAQPSRPTTRDYPASTWKGLKGAPLRSIELMQFNPFQTLDEASTLRFTLDSGESVDVKLRTADGYTPFTTDPRDSAAYNKGIGEEKAVAGTLEIPEEAARHPSEKVRRFLEKYLRPYHHVPNLFGLTADQDHVDMFTTGNYRRSDKGFDTSSVPEVSVKFTRDARGESEYEQRASAPALTPRPGMTAAERKELVRENIRLRWQLFKESGERRRRHLGLWLKTFFAAVGAGVAIFFMNLFGLTRRKHLGPISELAPRLLDGQLSANDLKIPESYDRALEIIDKNIEAARKQDA